MSRESAAPLRLALTLATAAMLLLPASPSAYDRAHPPVLHRGGAARPAGAPRTDSAFPDAQPRFHNGAELVCSDCHVAHASQGHWIDPAAPGTDPLPYAGGANPNLIRRGDPLDLCLACHDNRTFAPDVITTDANNLTRRSAGFFADPEVINPNGHDLGRALPPSGGSWDFCSRCHWGTGAQVKVTCVDCHNPHGNGIARNLQWASDPASTPDLGLFVNPAATGLDRYEAENVAYGTLDSPTLREVNNICLDCHHVFSGGSYVDPDGDGIHNRHPAYDSERASTNHIAQGLAKGSSDPAHWEGGSGSGFGSTPRVPFLRKGATGFVAARVVDAPNNGVFCLSCHDVHGSDQPFGLVWNVPGGSGPAGCDQCHRAADGN